MRPFRVCVAESELALLRERIAATRWAADLPGAGWTRGVPADYLRDLADYWRTVYDWRAAEARLNRYDQYLSTIDGARVHFLHIRSPRPDALPLVLTHGWPGSVAEFLEVIPALTDPATHGAPEASAFHLVIPSIPGYGFSGPITDGGWNITRIARAWATLMARLGYHRYGAAGGDFGSAISLEVGRVDPAHVAGVHTNMLAIFPTGDPAELAGLSDADLGRLGRLQRFDNEGSGYLKLLSTRPQTVSYALNDSPVGQLAWIMERFREWSTPDGLPEEVIDRDLLLTNVMIYWLTGTASSSAQLYYEVMLAQRAAVAAAGMLDGYRERPVDVPLGVAVFPNDCVLPVRRLADRDLSTIIHWREYDQGGHFPAMEVPDLYVEEIRTFFGPLAAKDR